MSDFVSAMHGMGCVFSSWVDICLDLSLCFVFRSWVPFKSGSFIFLPMIMERCPRLSGDSLNAYLHSGSQLREETAYNKSCFNQCLSIVLLGV